MATLASPTATLVLPARCLVGRSRDCDLVARARDVSARHALLEWDGADWRLRDLGSRNGTWLDGERLSADAQPVVSAGAQMRFGREAEPWVLQDASAPELMAVCLIDRRQELARSGYLALPEPSGSPEHYVYRDAAGTWVHEHGGLARTVENREIIVAADTSPWRVHLPDADPATWQRDPDLLELAHLQLRLSYSRDEEHVEAVVTCGDRSLDLEARAHHYLLLVLARRRLADEAAGRPEAERGWIGQDELVTMLRMTDNHIYITIHRARAQLGELGVVDAAGLVERRARHRQMRLGVRAVELVPLDAP